ncbi:MAG: hypothetical protein AAF085_06745 [Planctomycetota bacterium]
MTRKTRRRLRFAVIGALLVFVAACAFLPDYPRILSSGKYDPVEESTPKPTDVATTPKAGTQTEPHTCGWHAMSSMYTAYGLKGETFNLRFRLGTDEPAMRADKDSTGTLHPDLYRVLAQDGFTAEPLDLESDVAVDALQNHMAWQQLALVVVYRSTYHWVLVGPAGQAGELVVYDSLKDTPVTVPVDDLLDEALSITLVEPSDGEAISTSTAHAEGLREMARLYQRKE